MAKGTDTQSSNDRRKKKHHSSVAPSDCIH